VNVSTCPRCGGSGKTVDALCTRCRGEGRERRDHELPLDIPAGIDDGQQLRVAGEGEAGLRGGPSGDLYVLIRLREHTFFRREGDDLVHVLRISPAQAALGADLEVPTIEGATAAVKVPSGAQHGQMVRLRAKGVPHLGSSGRGDQLVYLDVAIPRTLTKEPERTGMVAGTLYFMPREQITHFRLLRPASDVWSMGATLYHMLTLRYPRDFPPEADPLNVILAGGTLPLRQRDPWLPARLAEVVDRAVADDLAERYATAAEFRDALRRAL